MRGRRRWVAAPVAAVLALAGCSGTGSAFAYGDQQETGSISSEPIAYGHDAVVGLPLDNRSGTAIELLSLQARGAMNVAIGTSSVAPVLRESDGSFLLFGANRVGDDPTLAREWAKRRALDGYRIAARQRNVQALLEVSVRDPSRPARITGLTVSYRQDGRVLTETNAATTCWFPPHRGSVCDQP